MSDFLLAMLLGAVQGVTEFLPVSSSGHLVLVPWLLDVPDPGLAFDVALHAGTLAAVLFVFWREWTDILRAAATRRAAGGFAPDMFWKIALASIPAALAGVFLEEAASGAFRAPLIVAGTLAGVAVLMAVADRESGEGTAADIGWGTSFLVGCAQAAALVPGVSRSGATMVAGIALGLSRAEAARFSFLLSVPITLGATVFALRHLTPADVTLPFIAGVIVSALTGIWAIRFLLRFLKRHNFAPFIVYRLALAVTVVLLVLSRR
ncbi:undecaprenyl-diphosphate phosphatase [Patescibacteria group bacterium]|nr:MAG: undecaprenyl-diphosphate phosphatase [Patescibacteria group bacterium]